MGRASIRWEEIPQGFTSLSSLLGNPSSFWKKIDGIYYRSEGTSGEESAKPRACSRTEIFLKTSLEGSLPVVTATIKALALPGSLFLSLPEALSPAGPVQPASAEDTETVPPPSSLGRRREGLRTGAVSLPLGWRLQLRVGPFPYTGVSGGWLESLLQCLPQDPAWEINPSVFLGFRAKLLLT